MEMFFVFFILGIGIYLIYFLVKKGSKETIPTKSVTKNIPDEVLKREYMGLREMFVNGEMSNKMATELILKKDEYLIFDIPNVSICEERAIKTKGSTKSVRVRVMKGVSVGLGGFEASSETKVIPIDTGNFTLTNKRVHFAGSTKTVDYPLSKINTIEELDSGIAISRSGKSKIEYYLGTDVMSLLVTISPEEDEDFDSEQISYALNGEECKGILLEAISRID
jgi:hypothetical protein